MQRILHLALVVGASFTLACGEEDKGPSTAPVDDPGTLDQSKATADQSAGFVSLPADADEAAAQPVITMVGAAVQGLVGRHQAAQAQAQAGMLSARRDFQTADGGTFTFADGRLTADLTYANGGTALHYVLDLQIGDDQLDGTYLLDFTTSQGGYDVETRYDVTYDALVFEGGCAVSGAVTVDYDFSVSGDALPPQARDQIADSVGGGGRIVATFEAGCGVSVEAS